MELGGDSKSGGDEHRHILNASNMLNEGSTIETNFLLLLTFKASTVRLHPYLPHTQVLIKVNSSQVFYKDCIFLSQILACSLLSGQHISQYDPIFLCPKPCHLLCLKHQFPKQEMSSSCYSDLCGTECLLPYIIDILYLISFLFITWFSDYLNNASFNESSQNLPHAINTCLINEHRQIINMYIKPEFWYLLGALSDEKKFTKMPLSI